MGAKEIEKALFTMSQEELLSLRNRIDLLLKIQKGTPGNSVADTSDESLLYQEIRKVYKSRFGLKLLPLKAFKKRPGGNNLKVVVTYLDKLSEEVIGKSTRIDKAWWYRLFIDLSLREMEKENIPLSVHNLLGFYERFPEVLNQAFPGYIESGLLTKILSKKGNEKNG